MSSTDVEGLPPVLAQAQLVDAIARSLVGSVEPGWTSIDYRRVAVSATSEGRLRVSYPDRDAQPLAPREVAKLAKQLRDVMYREGSGTWYTFALQVTPPAAVTSRFDYDHEPAWDIAVDPIVYVTDQHTHPRDAEHQPAWLQERLAEGWARINSLTPDRMPQWVEKRLTSGTHILTPTGLVERP